MEYEEDGEEDLDDNDHNEGEDDSHDKEKKDSQQGRPQRPYPFWLKLATQKQQVAGLYRNTQVAEKSKEALALSKTKEFVDAERILRGLSPKNSNLVFFKGVSKSL